MEIKDTQYHCVPSNGDDMFRIRDITGNRFEHPEQYDSLVSFVFQHVKTEMTNVYGLTEISVPLVGDETKLEKSEIFMTEEFVEPDVKVNG